MFRDPEKYNDTIIKTLNIPVLPSTHLYEYKKGWTC